jgi:uncharacterized protein (DUF924 family)
MNHSRDILKFWFGPQPTTPARLAERMDFWFGGAVTRDMLAHKDEDIRQRFEGMMRAAAAGELDRWADSPRQRLALIILLDQIPRHVHRGTAPAYASDARASELALEGMRIAADGTLSPVERIFFYMPLQHAESLELQEESVAAYRRLATEAPPGTEAQFQSVVKFAELHRDIVAEFGRFPHRNLALGRRSTSAEMIHLLGGGPRFGA